eukprot:5091033-Prorocentrum_lima.AAC.1
MKGDRNLLPAPTSHVSSRLRLSTSPFITTFTSNVLSPVRLHDLHLHESYMTRGLAQQLVQRIHVR